MLKFVRKNKAVAGVTQRHDKRRAIKSRINQKENEWERCLNALKRHKAVL